MKKNLIHSILLLLSILTSLQATNDDGFTSFREDYIDSEGLQLEGRSSLLLFNNPIQQQEKKQKEARWKHAILLYSTSCKVNGLSSDLISSDLQGIYPDYLFYSNGNLNSTNLPEKIDPNLWNEDIKDKIDNALNSTLKSEEYEITDQWVEIQLSQENESELKEKYPYYKAWINAICYKGKPQKEYQEEMNEHDQHATLTNNLSTPDDNDSKTNPRSLDKRGGSQQSINEHDQDSATTDSSTTDDNDNKTNPRSPDKCGESQQSINEHKPPSPTDSSTPDDNDKTNQRSSNTPSSTTDNTSPTSMSFKKAMCWILFFSIVLVLQRKIFHKPERS